MINFKYIRYCVCVIQILSCASGQDFGNIAGKWKIKYGLENEITEVQLKTSTSVKVPVQIYDIEKSAQQTADIYFRFLLENKKIASTEKHVNLSDIMGSTWEGEIEVNGLYFGYTHLYATLNDPQMENMEKSPQTLAVIVLRDKQVDDNIFTYTALAIMILMFVNLGTVLDLKRVRLVFTRPVGPILGFLSRYLIMPALALGLGALMFKEQKNLQLALLFSAIAPSGGIANICNIFLKGNINLSLAATTVNSVLALGMLPLWVYLMGPLLYKDGSLSIPFAKLGIGCAALLLALFVGMLLRVTIPKTTKFIFRFLKPVSIILSLSLIAVTVGINAFVFKEITLMVSCNVTKNQLNDVYIDSSNTFWSFNRLF